MTKIKAWLAGFKPAREDPYGFLVHRLNHSATTTTCEENSSATKINKNVTAIDLNFLMLKTCAQIPAERREGDKEGSGVRAERDCV